MPRFAYVDGRFLRHRDAGVPVEDRGLQFGDAVYEVWSVRDGVLFDAQGHFERLARSLKALQIPKPLNDHALNVVIKTLVARNKIKNGLVYLQVSRGVARRDHPFPKNPNPSIILTARPFDMAAADKRATTGLSVKSFKDNRWGRVDIKTINLLPNVLAKQAALEAGYNDAWFVDREGFVTEGSAQNAWIVDQAGCLRTRAVGSDILRGITRDTIIKTAIRLGYSVSETAFTLEEARLAREAFITSATSFVTPIVRIDDYVIANGVPGSVAIALREAYLAEQSRPLLR